MNSVQLVGRLGKEPVMRAAGDNQVCNFSIATRGFKKDETDWHNIVCWNKTAELAKKYLDKGSMVGINGRLQTRSYDKDGTTVYTTEVVANNVEFMDSKPKADQAQAPSPIDDDVSKIPF